MSLIDPEKLQHLVDGELSATETRELLRSIDCQSDDWRDIACAMIENQLFQKQFLLAAQHESNDEDAAVKNELAAAPVQQTEQDSPLPVQRNDHHSGSERRLFGFPLQSLAMAAGLMIALTTGYLVGTSKNDSMLSTDTGNSLIAESNLDDDADASNLVTNDEQELPTTTDPADPTEPSSQISPASYVEFEMPNGETPPGQVPLYNVADVKRLTGLQQDKQLDEATLNRLLPELKMSPEIRDQLGRSGYVVEVQTRYVTGDLGDGRKFIVPVRTMRWSAGN